MPPGVRLPPPESPTTRKTPVARAREKGRKRVASGVGIMAFSLLSRPTAREYCSPRGADCGTLARVNTVNRRRMQVIYSGQVQGVGFRYSVKSVATGFDLTGSVRNLPGGEVELLAEGSKDELEAFRQAIRESGLDHFIRQEDVSWQEARSEFRGFEIVR